MNTQFLDNSAKRKPMEMASNRKDYANIDFSSMGVNLKEHLKSSEKRNRLHYASQIDSNVISIRHLEPITQLDGKPAVKCIPTNSDKLEVLKNRQYKNNNFEFKNALIKKQYFFENENDKNNDLPFGWEKHEDNDGPYFWHIKSGTIQREPPKYKCNKDEKESDSSSFDYANNRSIEEYLNNLSAGQVYSNSEFNYSENYSMPRSRTIPSLNQEQGMYSPNLQFKRESSKLVRFTVRSLGWVKIAEEDLAPERSSKAVNKCIIDLSLGRNDLIDVDGRWGDGKDMYMDLEDGALKLVEKESLTVLNSQPIHTIRVWGVGRDNGRDFAYVSRDRLTRTHMCHVFRCDTTARSIANTLRDICKQIMIERSLQLDSSSARTTNTLRYMQEPTHHANFQTETCGLRHSQSFPAPMEEPKKILEAFYIGCQEVSRPTGMDIINQAINSSITQTKIEQWERVNVAIAPSMVTIRSSKDNGRIIAECRVRYLSFLGIGKNFKKCAFIVHTARNKFVAHVFHCEPSSGAFCKTVEAACKLRYQKCLDAHPENNSLMESNITNKGIKATIKDIIQSLSLKKEKCESP